MNFYFIILAVEKNFLIKIFSHDISHKVKFSGKDYPKPIINHYEATVKNLARMKSFRASQQNTVKLTSGILIVLL